MKAFTNKYRGVVVSDLDGTLLTQKSTIGNKDIVTLELLGDKGYLRVIATGRSLFSLQKVLPCYIPVDYIVFSSGAGIFDWQNQEIIQSHSLKENDADLAIKELIKREIDFSIQDEIPENHTFKFVKFHDNNADFERRNSIYKEYSSQIKLQDYQAKNCSQLIGIVTTGQGYSTYQEIKQCLPFLKVIRSTSPIDGKSLWIEIFPMEVSKSKGVEFLVKMLGIKKENVMAIGNDYNDLDLLRWVSNSFVVDNSPAEIKQEFKVVSSNENSGFTQAVSIWLNGGQIV